jgi:hypothetical protein
MKSNLKDQFLSKYSRLCVTIFSLVFISTLDGLSYASPYGQGNYSADVPYGSQTSLTINLGSNVSFNLTPSGSNYSAYGSQTIAVTSTNVVGYQLYIYSPTSTSMIDGPNTIPASSNVTEAPLAVNTWGYNSDNSGNYIGLTTTPALLENYSGPSEIASDTTVNYGVLASGTQAAGSYSATVTITAIGLNE